VVDLLDCSGSGDVDTSTIRKSENGQLLCLSGRLLNVGAFESSPSGEYRLGVKRGYELMPKALVTRTIADRKEKFEKIHRAHLNSLQVQLDAFNLKYQRHSDVESQENPVELSENDKKEKEELQAQIEQVLAMMSGWSDFGPLYDVIVWKAADGEWRVVVDTAENGDITQMKVLRVFSSSGDFSNFGSENMMNYSVNVWKDGSIVELVVNAGGHGTHVAGIVGAYFGDNDPNNGVAPGCQLIGLKIGDSRLGSMETGVGMVRALIAARERKVDIINVSYGEPAALPNSGRIAELINELVYKHGVIFVTSASNSGPCLTTVGSPGASTHAAIAVAAVVSPAMMEQQYSMRDASERKLGPYNWSSRGPSLDGGYGPSIAAPGGAIAPVPNWYLQKNQLMNGTSMASPNACGSITLLLSALKQTHTPYSPATVRLAVENTAKEVEDSDYTAVGHGLIQVASSYDYHMRHSAVLNPKVRISATVPNRGNGRGILLRDADHFAFPEIEELISVEPHFSEDTSSDEKINFDARYEIRSTLPGIVTVPNYFQLPNGGRSFKVHIRLPELTPETERTGIYFTGEIQGVNLAHPELGPAFVVPVTIIRGARVSSDNRIFEYEQLPCRPSIVHRRFFEVPESATWATITLKSVEFPYARTLFFACQQVIPDQSHKFSLIDKYFAMKGNDNRVVRVPVLGGLTMEVAIGQLWSSIGSEGSLSFSVEFSGIKVDETPTLTSYGEIAKLRVHNSMATKVVQIKPKLCVVSRSLHPSSISAVSPLHRDRDLLTKERLIYQVVITYTYTTEEASTKVLLRSPFSSLLYDSPYESQLIMVYDNNKVLVETVDYNPEWITLPTKGTWTIRMQLRHEDVAVLEKLKNVPINIERQVAKDKGVTLSVYQTFSAALSGGKKFPADGVKYTTQPHFPIYIQAPLSQSLLPSYVKPGDVLIGYMSMAKIDGVKDSYFADSGLDPQAVAVVPIKFVVPSKLASSATPTVSAATATAAASVGRVVVQAPAPVHIVPVVVASSSPPAPSLTKVDQSMTPPPTVPPGVPTPTPIVSLPPTESSTPSVSPAPSGIVSSTPPTEATNFVVAAAAASSSSSSSQGAIQSSSSPLASGAHNASKSYEFLMRHAIASLNQLIAAQQFEEWATREAEFAVILPTLRAEAEAQLQSVLYFDWLFVKNPNEFNRASLTNACDLIINDIDTNALAIYFGTRHPNEAPAERQKMERIVSYLVAALGKKSRTFPSGTSEHSAIIAEISRWVDPVTIPYISTQPSAVAQIPKYGIALRNARKKIAAGERPTAQQQQEIISILKSLGWNHWVQHFEGWLSVRSILNYNPF
jgi:tripeptidyl-peptidase-2